MKKFELSDLIYFFILYLLLLRCVCVRACIVDLYFICRFSAGLFFTVIWTGLARILYQRKSPFEIKKLVPDCNDMKVSKWWQNVYFWVSYDFMQCFLLVEWTLMKQRWIKKGCFYVLITVYCIHDSIFMISDWKRKR